MEKCCSKCQKMLNVENFNRHPVDKSGYQSYCKDCIREYDKPRKGIKRHGIDRPEINRKVECNYKKKYPERVQANYLVQRAVKTGKLIKGPCEKCGNNNVLGHHEDYSNPLDVRWLCLIHHNEVHRL